MVVQNWYTVTMDSLKGLWVDFLDFIPSLIGALIILIIGWFVSVGIGRLVSEILRRVKFNKLFERGIWSKALSRADWKVDASGFIGSIVKWVLFIMFLLAAVEILGFVQFAVFVNQVVSWLPNVIVAAAIFVVAAIIADYLPKILRAATEGMRIQYGRFLQALAKWAIWVFAIVAILVQLGIAREVIMTLFTGFVAFLVIAGGLSFGLGGRDFAAGILRDLQAKLRKED